MIKIVADKKLCPFCHGNLRESITNCPHFTDIPCLECKPCHAYFYTKHNKEILRGLAFEKGRKLNHDVFAYQLVTVSCLPQKKKMKKVKLQKIKTKNGINLKSHNKSPFTTEVATEVNHIGKTKKLVINDCRYNKKGFCFYIDDNCSPMSVRCVNYRAYKAEKNLLLDHVQTQSKIVSPLTYSRPNDIAVMAIVISDNRRCPYNNHSLQDIDAKVNIVTPNGHILMVSFPSVYCANCNEYFILKRDFKNVKDRGVLLCSVEDRTEQYIQKHCNNSYKTIGESRIHKMGYNVRKDYGYTDIQRDVILANIIENTTITKHEILSVIDADIARHKSKSTHQNAIKLWMKDREFVSKYIIGDMPEVLIKNIVVAGKSIVSGGCDGR